MWNLETPEKTEARFFLAFQDSVKILGPIQSITQPGFFWHCKIPFTTTTTAFFTMADRSERSTKNEILHAYGKKCLWSDMEGQQ